MDLNCACQAISGLVIYGLLVMQITVKVHKMSHCLITHQTIGALFCQYSSIEFEHKRYIIRINIQQKTVAFSLKEKVVALKF